jgi:hypothetical protein
MLGLSCSNASSARRVQLVVHQRDRAEADAPNAPRARRIPCPHLGHQLVLVRQHRG